MLNRNEEKINRGREHIKKGKWISKITFSRVLWIAFFIVLIFCTNKQIQNDRIAQNFRYENGIMVARSIFKAKIIVDQLYEEKRIDESMYYEFDSSYDYTYEQAAAFERLDVSSLNESIKVIFKELEEYYVIETDEKDIDINGVAEGILFFETDFIIYRTKTAIPEEKYAAYEKRKAKVWKEISQEGIEELMKFGMNMISEYSLRLTNY